MKINPDGRYRFMENRWQREALFIFLFGLSNCSVNCAAFNPSFGIRAMACEPIYKLAWVE